MKVIRNAVCICMLVIALMPVFAAGNAENASNSGGRQEVRVLLWDSIYNSTIEPNGIEAKFEAAYPQYDVVFDIPYDSVSDLQEDGYRVDIDSLVRNDFRTTVDWTAHAGEDTTEHVFGYRQLQSVTEETNLAVAQVDTCGVFEQLNNSVAAVYFQNLAAADLAAWQFDLTQLIVGDTFYAGDHHQRTCDFSYGAVFF